jgi:tetratricopeptide (TPR) repeat protein
LQASQGTFADLKALERRLQTLDDLHVMVVQQLETITNLVTELSGPMPRLPSVIERAKLSLGIEPTHSLLLITSTRSVAPLTFASSEEELVDKESLAEQILKEVDEGDQQYLTKCLDAAWIHQVRGELEAAQAVYVKIEPIQASARNARVLEGRAELAALRGDFTESLRLTDALIDVLTSTRSSDLMALALARKDRASRSWANGDLEASAKYYALARDAYSQARRGRPEVKANIDNEMGYYFYLKGDFGHSLEYASEAVAYLSKETSSNYGKPHAFNNAGLLFANLGRNADALAYYNQAIDVLESTVGKRTRLHGTIFFDRGHIKLKMGDYEAAERDFQDAGIIFDRWRSDLFHIRLVEVSKAYTSFLRSRMSSGLGELRRALAELEVSSNRSSHWPVSYRTQLSRLYRISGDLESAKGAIGAVDPAAEIRAPQARRDYRIERGTVARFAVTSATEFDDADVVETFSDRNRIFSPYENVRFLLYLTLKALGNSDISKAVEHYCAARRSLDAVLRKDEQLMAEARLVQLKFVRSPECS